METTHHLSEPWMCPSCGCMSMRKIHRTGEPNTARCQRCWHDAAALKGWLAIAAIYVIVLMVVLYQYALS